MGDEQGKTVNEAITQLERSVDAELCAKNAVIAELEATVAKAFLALGEVAEALEALTDLDRFFDGQIGTAGEDWRESPDGRTIHVVLQIGHIRKAKAVRERIRDLCHATPVPGGETSSAEGPHQTGDGETR